MTPTIDMNAAHANIMNAIYARTASTPTPLTPENCQAVLSYIEGENRLALKSNNVVQVLCPILYREAFLKDFGSKMYRETHPDDGALAALRIKIELNHFCGGCNYVDFAEFRLAKDGAIIRQSFEIDEATKSVSA